ncbi:MAG: hypothetical protein ACR2GN_09565 [Bacteroidia bacterium]
MNELTERERKVFEYLTSGGENLAITHTLFNGIKTCCIVILDKQEDETYEITPVAILVNEELFKLLKSLPEEIQTNMDLTI